MRGDGRASTPGDRLTVWRASVALVIIVTLAACGSGDPGTAPSGESPTTVTSEALPADTSIAAATTTAPDSTTAPTSAAETPDGTPADAVVTELCVKPADVIVRTILDGITGRTTTAPCVSAELIERLPSRDQSWFTAEVEAGATWTENPIRGTSGWVVHVALDMSEQDGGTSRVIQQWTLTTLSGATDDATDGVDVNDSPAGGTTDGGGRGEGPLIVTAIDDVDTTQEVADGLAFVTDYLGHLAAGRYDAAADILGRGGQEWDERPDMSAFRTVPDDLAAALRDWCEQGAQCTLPTSLTARSTVRGGAAEVTATWELTSGEATATATFIGYGDEGAPAARGLPPLTGDGGLAVLADAANATVAVATMPDGRIVTWVNGRVAQATIPDDTYAWSDGAFLYWSTSSVDEAGNYMEHSFAADLDSGVVCEADGSIHRVRERTDGTFVASVERADEAVASSDEYPIPNYAVECATGERQPIATRSWHREGGGRAIERVGDRTFMMNYDAEGNGDGVNASGLSINGDDYAGFHVFSPDGSRVVYGDYGGISPHTTTTIRSRDTSDGTLLWSIDVPRSFSTLIATADRVIVGQPSAAAEYQPWDATEAVLVFDAATGTQLRSIPTAIDLLHLG